MNSEEAVAIAKDVLEERVVDLVNNELDEDGIYDLLYHSGKLHMLEDEDITTLAARMDKMFDLATIEVEWEDD